MSVEIREHEGFMITVPVSNNYGVVVSFTLSDDKKTVGVVEGLDCIYEADLAKKDLAMLITALQAMHDKMTDNNQGE